MMEKGANKVLLIIGILLCACFCFTIGQYVMKDCFWWECGPSRGFRIKELELPKDLFTNDALIQTMTRLSEGEGAREDGIQGISWNGGNGIAVYQVFRFPSMRITNQKFDFYKNQMTNRDTNEFWKPNENISFSSKTANRTYAACGKYSEYRCGMVAQYQDYVIFINSTIDEEMTYRRFQNILIYIDNTISEKLNLGNR
jgi:hypothetical protein